MKLTNIHIKGFKSIDGGRGQSIDFGDITVLLGANGAGKSNLLSFFRMLGFMTTGALQQYVGKYGVSSLLFYGPQKTESINFTITLKNDEVVDTYSVKLSYGLPDRLFISNELGLFQQRGETDSPNYYFNGGILETSLAQDENQTSQVLSTFLGKIKDFQFHDTSDTARIKDRVYIDDASYLRHDAGNLAAFLKMLKETEEYKKYYARIIRHIQSVMPQFGDFSLQTLPNNPDYVRLNWVDKTGSNYLFGPHQISDGSLRFMALTTLLLQPPAFLPRMIIIDEPELGLHPDAIAKIAGMMRTASHSAQIVIATQSTRLVDEFDPENLVIAERDTINNCSVFKKLQPEELQTWLEQYTLSELWEKNVLGGRP